MLGIQRDGLREAAGVWGPWAGCGMSPGMDEVKGIHTMFRHFVAQHYCTKITSKLETGSVLLDQVSHLAARSAGPVREKGRTRNLDVR